MRAVFSLLLVAAALSGCAAPAPATAMPPTETGVPTTIPTDTPTSTPSPIPPTPTSTPLPGAVVLPIDSMADGIPWLPLDEKARPGVHSVFFNTTRPPFDNALVRQAFAAAVDRELIVAMAQKYGAPNWTPATTFTPPQTLGRDLYNQVGIAFDPQRAKDLLAQAGYSDVSAFPTAKLIVASYGDIAPGVRFNMAKAMAKMWQETLGVKVEVQAIGGFREYGNRLKTDPPEMFWMGWVADVNDPDNFMQVFHSSSENNRGKFSSAEYDRLLASAARLGDPVQRQLIYLQAEQLLCETEAALIPLYHVR